MAPIQPPALSHCSHCGSAEFTFEDGGVRVCRRCIDGAVRAAFYPELISVSGLLAIAEKHPAVDLIMQATNGRRCWVWRVQPASSPDLSPLGRHRARLWRFAD